MLPGRRMLCPRPLALDGLLGACGLGPCSSHAFTRLFKFLTRLRSFIVVYHFVSCSRTAFDCRDVFKAVMLLCIEMDSGDLGDVSPERMPDVPSLPFFCVGIFSLPPARASVICLDPWRCLHLVSFDFDFH